MCVAGKVSLEKIFAVRTLKESFWYLLHFVYLAEAGIVMGQGVY
jgi:hypothetical protein